MKISPVYLKDFYKVGHVYQYPKGTELIFSNFTPRKSRVTGVNHSIFFGLTYFIKEYLDGYFREWFENPYDYEEYDNFMQLHLGGHIHYAHMAALHDLGYLPIEIYALPEGSAVPCGVPALVIYNTDPLFFWLPNMLETLMSCILWGPCTSATIARQYRILLDDYAKETSDIPEFVLWQAHDFSFRGMYGLEAAILSGAAHLMYFKGSDSIPAIFYAKEYDSNLLCNIAGAVPATEHSVMSAGGKESEFDTYKRLITEIYPSRIVSIVSDTWNLWHVVDNILPQLKEIIMARDGKVVIRPDSGDPLEIICGRGAAKGLIDKLWDIFGGEINSKGYKQLDPHIGAIYGDSITLERAKNICDGLKQKGFASTNIVFGIGSYTYQYNTRDTLGWAMKATYCEINGIGHDIFKDPITDDGTKKSHKGILKVIAENGYYKCLQQVSWNDFHSEDNQLKLVYANGKII